MGNGTDSAAGGTGNDSISTGTGNDTVNPGPGADVVNTGDGNDTINARDGEAADTIDCGNGIDTLTADIGDAYSSDCETVDLLAPPDTTPPNTSIGKTKIKGRAGKAKFSFSSSEPGSSFLCRLGKKRFKPCSSPKAYRNLKPGRHRFQVKARDSAGNLDPSPASKKFRIP
jgi:RTX calcium-binding nonapeptide repeat (4 copies)